MNVQRMALGALVLAAGLLPLPLTVVGAVTDEQQQKIQEAVPDKARAEPAEPRNVLVWTRAVGFKHSSIPHGARAVELMGEKTGAFTTVVSDDLSVLLPDNLKQFDAVVLNNTTGNWIRPRQEDLPKLGGGEIDELEQKLRNSLLQFVENGGGLVGFHSATDANYHWPEFGQLIGGYFHHHPWHEQVRVRVEKPDHALARVFEGDFDIVDEIYQFRDPYSRDRLNVLLSLDVTRTNMDKGNIHRTDDDFAVAWIRSQGDGRVFYSSLGHREEIFWNPKILQFYLDGIQFALGDLAADTTPHPAPPPGPVDQQADQQADQQDDQQDWVALFDGSNLDAWTFKPDGWKIEDGVLALQPGGGYIWTAEPYGDFVLDLEFKMSPRCNSGVFFRTDPGNPVQGGFEIQILDSHGKEQPGKHDCGSLYDALAPSKNAVKPAGQWNRLRLTCQGPQVTVVLNGEQILQADLDQWTEANRNPDGSRNKFNTPLKDLPRTGHIGLQDHGNPVWFRNIKLKTL